MLTVSRGAALGRLKMAYCRRRTFTATHIALLFELWKFAEGCLCAFVLSLPLIAVYLRQQTNAGIPFHSANISQLVGCSARGPYSVDYQISLYVLKHQLNQMTVYMLFLLKLREGASKNITIKTLISS